MSRSSAIVESPVVRYLQWKTQRNDDEKIIGGNFVYYDKDEECNVVVDNPFRFAILNPDRVTFKGYNDKTKQGVWSNEVGSSASEAEVNVKSKSGSLLKFKKKDYQKVKDNLKALGAKYTQVVYVAVGTTDGWEIWGITLSGAALTGGVDRDDMDPDERNDGWFNFIKNAKPKMYSNFIEVSDFKVKKKGATKFSIPVYEVAEEVPKKDADALFALDKQLEKYFTFYDGQVTEKLPEPVAAGEDVEDDDEIPF